VKIFHKGLRQLLAAHPHWRPSPTGSGHLKLTSPTGAVVYAVARPEKSACTAASPRTWRGRPTLMLRKPKTRRRPTEAESRWLRRIEPAGGRLTLTHRAGTEWYADGAGKRIPTRAAQSITRFMLLKRDGLFDLTPQSWRTRRPEEAPAP
jgi:hypothetical protein